MNLRPETHLQGSRKWLWVMLIVALIVGVATFFVLSDGSSNESTPKSAVTTVDMLASSSDTYNLAKPVTQPNNEIWYTSSDGSIVVPNVQGKDVFGAEIESNTYEGGKGVIKFKGDVTSIGYGAFVDCSNFTSVTIPNSVTTIGKRAFEDCRNLTSITIPNSVTTIGLCAFYECRSLASVTIPNSVTTIGEYAFFCCKNLYSVTIPNSVTTIGEGAFAYCSSIKEFNGKFVSEDRRCLIIDGKLVAFAPAGIAEYTIPDSVTTIGESAFMGCEGLTSVAIPNSVTTIGGIAFSKCIKLSDETKNKVREINPNAKF